MKRSMQEKLFDTFMWAFWSLNLFKSTPTVLILKTFWVECCFDLFWASQCPWFIWYWCRCVCVCVQICVGSAERPSFSSSRGTSESIPKQPSTFAKSLKIRGYEKKDTVEHPVTTVFFHVMSKMRFHRFSIVDDESLCNFVFTLCPLCPLHRW